MLGTCYFALYILGAFLVKVLTMLMVLALNSYMDICHQRRLALTVCSVEIGWQHLTMESRPCSPGGAQGRGLLPRKVTASPLHSQAQESKSCRDQAAPPSRPAGLATASESAKRRWAENGWIGKVYMYEEAVMLRSISDGSLQLPSDAEREALFGFDKEYTMAALEQKTGSHEKFCICASLIGKSFCVHVVSFLVNELLNNNFGVSCPRETYTTTAVSTKPWNTNEVYIKRSNPVSYDEQRLVYEWARRAERTGSDVRLDIQQPYRVKAWPRAGVRSGLWSWEIVHGYEWAKPDAHINLFELLAVVNTVKWRLRKAENQGKRFLHLSDSQVVVSVCAKGRTSSRKLIGTLKRYNSLLLAAQLYPMYAFIASEDNPSDKPSRWAEAKTRRKQTKHPPPRTSKERRAGKLSRH